MQITRTLRGFTLIELLIVVAIIAILAAIAVPNFLEAQVRSKTSRAKADMRSLATALEAYTVDYNRPPLGNPSSGPPYAYRWGTWALSTPVAYITYGWIPDPFLVTQVLVRRQNDLAQDAPPHVTVLTDYQRSFQYSLRIGSGAGTAGLAGSGQGPGTWWYLQCVGPDKDLDSISDNMAANNVARCINVCYDPTNGTISNGNLYRVGGSGANQAGQAVMNATLK